LLEKKGMKPTKEALYFKYVKRGSVSKRVRERESCGPPGPYSKYRTVGLGA
jgi:hypothetical protein